MLANIYRKPIKSFQSSKTDNIITFSPSKRPFFNHILEVQPNLDLNGLALKIRGKEERRGRGEGEGVGGGEEKKENRDQIEKKKNRHFWTDQKYAI